MNSLGLPLAVDPNTIPSSLSPSPQVLLLVDRRNSSRLAVGAAAPGSSLNRKNPWRNRWVSPPTVSRESLYPCMAHTQLSSPYCMLLGPPWVSRMFHVPNSTSRPSAFPSPSVSVRNTVWVASNATTPPRAKQMLVGMLSPSANTVTLSARPSPSASSHTTILSRPLAGGFSSFG